MGHTELKKNTTTVISSHSGDLNTGLEIYSCDYSSVSMHRLHGENMATEAILIFSEKVR